MKYKSPLRRMLERKILGYMSPGIELGRGDIKRMLWLDKAQMTILTETIKRVLDDLMDEGKIECVNPGEKTGLRFRMKRS